MHESEFERRVSWRGDDASILKEKHRYCKHVSSPKYSEREREREREREHSDRQTLFSLTPPKY